MQRIQKFCGLSDSEPFQAYAEFENICYLADAPIGSKESKRSIRFFRGLKQFESSLQPQLILGELSAYKTGELKMFYKTFFDKANAFPPDNSLSFQDWRQWQGFTFDGTAEKPLLLTSFKPISEQTEQEKAQELIAQVLQSAKNFPQRLMGTHIGNYQAIKNITETYHLGRSKTDAAGVLSSAEY